MYLTRTWANQDFELTGCKTDLLTKSPAGPWQNPSRGQGEGEVTQKFLHFGLFRTNFRDSKLSKMFCEPTFLCVIFPLYYSSAVSMNVRHYCFRSYRCDSLVKLDPQK